MEEEAREEERRQEQEKEKEERRRRSQTVRRKEKRDDQREQERRSKSLPRNSVRSWDWPILEEEVEVEESRGGVKERRRRRSEMKSRRRATEADREEEERAEVRERREERDNSTARHAKHSGSSGAAFSFLMPMDDDRGQHLSDNESAASFSEVSLSAASIATAGWREDSNWRRAESSWQQGNTPGPWLKPSPRRLTQALTGSRRSGRELAGGLSL